MKVIAFVVYHYLGITSVRGFQMLGSAMAAIGAIGMNWLILTRLKLPANARPIALSAFNLLLITNPELQRLAAFAVLLYPMRILTGFVFVYILAHYSANNPVRFPGVLAPVAWLVVADRKSTRLNSSHIQKSRMPSSA